MRFDLPYSEGSSWERRFIWWHAWLSHPSHANDAADQSNNVGNFHLEILKHEWKIWNLALESPIIMASQTVITQHLFYQKIQKYISLVNLQLISQHFSHGEFFNIFHAESGIHFPLQTSDILTFCILKNTEPMENISSFHQNLKITIYSRWRKNRGHATEHLQHKSPGNNII